ncbi:hypothetical protein AVEN_80667-1 [Araneus ventricosus]|uniref:Uncharacterized protein n=1 Tax=Araneus ventricosus TaxID=182803 RepID=A0A4Y2WC64_ARAVE|nr:hypothetical protein AVEN_125827-1 [Araneus ventricosus]GBO34244.1 hypothetical protein AVEN_80667-1 [Araneus ventricosus]
MATTLFRPSPPLPMATVQELLTLAFSRHQDMTTLLSLASRQVALQKQSAADPFRESNLLQPMHSTLVTESSTPRSVLEYVTSELDYSLCT